MAKFQSFQSQTFSVKGTSKKRNRGVYFPIETIDVRSSAKNMENASRGMFKTPKKNHYIIEIDSSKKDKNSHFHVWKSSEDRFRISHTRSYAVDVFSGLGREEIILPLEPEQRDNRKLNSNEQIEILQYLSDDNNRFALFCLIEMVKQGKETGNIFFNANDLLDSLNEADYARLWQKYNNELGKAKMKRNERNSGQFGK